MSGLKSFLSSVCILGFFLCGDGFLAAQDLVNLAGAGQGGHIVFFSSQFDEGSWNVDHLIDGGAAQGWAGQSQGPQFVVIGFQDNRLAELHDILINPYTREGPSNWVRQVEILVSETYPFRGFRSAGKFDLSEQGSDQLFSFPQPVRARYLKILFLANGGGGYMEAGEIQAMGKLLPDAPPAPGYANLAAAAAGARIEKYSSQYDETGWAASNLIKEDGRDQWAGQSGASQEVVVALSEAGLVSDVCVSNYSREAPANWAREVEISISAESSYKGFQQVGRLEMPQAADLHLVSLNPPRAAKYVKFFFKSNHGGGYMEASRVKVFRAEAGDAPAGAVRAVAEAERPLAEQLAETGRAVVHEIHFSTNSAEILPASAPILAQIAEALKASPSLELIIEGHTDNVGDPQLNLELSRKRAESVRRWLADREGISEVRLTTVGYGETRPIADNSSEEGRAENRRVELVRKN